RPTLSLSSLPATTLFYSLSLHDALPIYLRAAKRQKAIREMTDSLAAALVDADLTPDALLAALGDATGAAGVKAGPIGDAGDGDEDRKSTRLNSSHVKISYAVFCLKKKKE